MTEIKGNHLKRGLAVLAITSLAISASAPLSMAEPIQKSNEEYISVNDSRAAPNDTRARINYNLPGIPSRNLTYYSSKKITLNGKNLSGEAPIINGITYVSVKSLSEALGAKVSYSSTTKTMTVSAQGLYMTLTDSGYVIYANDRPLFSFSPTIVMNNGEAYAPLSALEKAFGIKVSAGNRTVALSGSMKPSTCPGRPPSAGFPRVCRSRRPFIWCFPAVRK